MTHGGKRQGAGRKSKAEEQNLVEKLSPLAPKAFKALDDALQDGQSWAVKMFMEYTYGKPKETVENINTNYNHELTKEEADAVAKALMEKY